MTLIRVALQRPTAVISVVLMVVLFGIVALQTIPIQLTPDVNRPVITVTTNWFGAAPAEIEREIVIRQEEVLKGINGLSDITSTADQGQAQIRLEFDIGTNMDRALLLVSNRLARVTSYPAEADEPSLQTAGAEDSPIAWFILTRQEGNETPIHQYGDFVENVLKDRIERVNGVGLVNVYGGSEREIEVVIDATSLARYGLTVSEVLDRLRMANSAISAGDVDEGKRRYVVRTDAELNTIESINNVLLRSGQDETTGRLARVLVSDIAEVRFTYKEPGAKIRMLGEEAIAFNAQRETGANVIETMRGIEQAVAELNRTAVAARNLKLEQVYDETVYINSSVDLVTQNIWVGGTLAAIILLIFLRSFRATLIISLAIPISVIGSFVAMAALGRSLNVISLAGIAFAVGMVVDAAIVVLENIYRLREQGKPTFTAALQGAQQVWGAIFVSALTTVMVFIPVLIMELEVGQLFRDIAVAISVSVLLSLLVSITMLPALANRLLSDNSGGKLRLPIVDHFGRAFAAVIVGFTKLVLRSRVLAAAVVAAISISAGIAAWTFLPKLEYLPNGNSNLMFGIVIPPPGYNLDTTTKIAERIEQETRPSWARVTGPESAPGEPVKMEHFFFVATPSVTFLGASAANAERAIELQPVLQTPVFKEPGTFAIVSQFSIFGSDIGGGRKIELDISGPELEPILGVAMRATGLVMQNFPMDQGNQFRPNPGLELGAPEIRVLPARMKLADNGLSASDLGNSIDAFNDGVRVTEVTVGNDRLDLMLKGKLEKVTTTQDINALPVVTQSGTILPVSALADVILTAGPTTILHKERARTVSLEIVPSPQLPLEEAINIIQTQIIAPLEAEGLPAGIRMNLAGTADQLTETADAMARDLLIALVIVYLVMAILFESFVYPLVIMLSVPVAAAGGVGGLALLNMYQFQPLDMLTLLGFVILIGIVVNNAILIVHQALLHIREEGMAPKDGIIEATRNRIRPIFMSTLTSVFGMLPLVLFPGAGSELYRGLGSVVVGGLALSALLVLIIIPPMLSLIVAPLEARRKGAVTEAAVAGAVKP